MAGSKNYTEHLMADRAEKCLRMSRNCSEKPQAYHPLFVWSTVLFNGRYGYEFRIAFPYDAIFRAF